MSFPFRFRNVDCGLQIVVCAVLKCSEAIVKAIGSQVGRRSPAAPRPVPRDGRYTVGTRPIESFPRAYVAVSRCGPVCQCVPIWAAGGRGRGLARQSLLRCVAHVDCIYRLFWKGWSAPWSRRHDQACSIGSSGTAPSAPSMELTLYTVTSCAPTWRMS